jgi:hypothetical protein
MKITCDIVKVVTNIHIADGTQSRRWPISTLWKNLQVVMYEMDGSPVSL